MPIQKIHISSAIIRLLLILILISAFGFIDANAQDHSAQILKEARAKYEGGYFDLVISMLDSSIAKKHFLEPEQREEAYSLLARAYIAMDYPEKAEKTVKQLLKQNKKFEAETPMDLKFQRLVSELNKQQRPIEKKSNMKYWILGGTAVGTGIAWVAYWLLKPEEEQPLPGPPSTPN